MSSPFASFQQDQEVIHAWLQDLHFEEYFNNFVQNGYDMPTITRMTPEVTSNANTASIYTHLIGFSLNLMFSF